jgi:hypothetical protein
MKTIKAMSVAIVSCQVAFAASFAPQVQISVGPEVLLLILSAFSWLALIITSAHEQARTPGEKNLWVLGMIWGLPMRAFGATGVCLLLVHSVVFSLTAIPPKAAG